MTNTAACTVYTYVDPALVKCWANIEYNVWYLLDGELLCEHCDKYECSRYQLKWVGAEHLLLF